MRKIIIKQAKTEDIPIIENILLDTVNWLNEMEQPLWRAGEVSWDVLSKNYQIGDFYIAYSDGKPSGCMALVDYDPFFWPDVKRGESLFIHKLAVTKTARKSGVADALIDFFKKQGAERGVKTLRLDTHALRPKLRAFYERNGFAFVKVKVFKGKRHTAFYIYTLPDSVLAQNKSSMKNLLFICGPNGIGKTTICKEIIRKLPNSAYVDSDSCRLMNPFVLNDETIPTIAKNISDLIINYIDCPVIETVVFSYGFHGRRREVFEKVIHMLGKKDFIFIPLLLTCSEEENIKRMNMENRSLERQKRAIEESRKAFGDLTYPQIDITDFSASEAAENIIKEAGLSLSMEV